MAAALVFYSIGVWGERIVGRLKWWHLVFFGIGLVCDSWGTGTTFDIHSISGFLAIALMAINAVWALIVLIKKDEKARANFHKFGIFVWVVWLIPYFSPMIFSLTV